MHCTDRRRDDGAARVLELFSRVQVGLLAYHSFSEDFFDLSIRVRDDPMASQQLRRLRAFVTNADRVSEDIPILLRQRLVFDVVGGDLDADVVVLVIVHECHMRGWDDCGSGNDRLLFIVEAFAAIPKAWTTVREELRRGRGVAPLRAERI